VSKFRGSDHSIPKKTLKKTMDKVTKIGAKELVNPLKVIAVLQSNISDRFLLDHYAQADDISTYQREVILSLYLLGKK
jgi:hypothetical protein